MTDVIEKFLRYIAVDTQSSEESETFPSTEKQKNLARMLYNELREMGAADVYFNERDCFVYAKIPAADGGKSARRLGFIAHMDTSPEASGSGVKARFVENYDGGDILLNAEKNITLSPAQFPELAAYRGKTLIVTDGTTLLGADDKAGVAEIMAAAQRLLTGGLPHGEICIAFTPDEEKGGGIDRFDIERFGADAAYTVDGGGLGELEFENFNAASAHITISGLNVHTGEAKGKMVNAAQLAAEYEMLLPAAEKPEHTEGYEGFFHLLSISGDTSRAELKYLIRDHDRAKFESRKELMRRTADLLNAKYGEGRVQIEISDTYYNMREKIEPQNMFLIENAAECMKELGIQPKIQPIRGGTDGANLSFRGLPCPNLFTGGHNYHGVYEYVCAESMELAAELIVKLACKG